MASLMASVIVITMCLRAWKGGKGGKKDLRCDCRFRTLLSFSVHFGGSDIEMGRTRSTVRCTTEFIS